MTISSIGRSARGLALTLLLGGCATVGRGEPAAPPLAADLAAIFADTALAHAHWGVLFRSLDSGETIFALNPDRLFVPASNMKLVTGASVLEALGPDYRYRTEVSAAGPVQNGVLRGNLVVRGTGDPTLSERFLQDERDVFRAWADSLRAHGITRIAGGIIGIDSAFTGPPIGAGWAWDDLESTYSSEYSALQYNEGVLDILLVPSRNPGEPAVVMLDPPTQYVPVNNRTRTTDAATRERLSVSRDPVGPGITITGEISPADTLVELGVAVRGSTDFFLHALRESLREAGIAVEGAALDADALPEEDRSAAGARLLFVHQSPPLREILPGMMKPSQNWIAETLLLTLGRERGREGSARAGAAVVDSIMRAWGLDADELRVRDGSGLSRYDLVSPSFLVGLLAHMDRSPHREIWLAALPIAGVDGTLRNRMREPPLAGNVRGKTGTLGGTRSLSGYLTTTSGERIVFSTLINNHARTAGTVDRVVEAALREIANR